jgi:L-iditol 2-dehydrogenase
MARRVHAQMTAVVLDGGGAPALRLVPAPRPRAGELHVRVRLVGLCGSDVEKVGDGNLEHVVLGHEIVAETLSGPGEVGRRVVVLHRVECGDCEECRSGHAPMCAQYLASGLRPGGFAEELVAPVAHVERAILAVPDHVTDAEAVLTEPLACVLRALEALPPGRHRVVGGGVMGQLAVRALVARGDAVEIAEPNAEREALAVAAGASRPGARIDADGAFVTVPAGLGAALRALRVGGTALVFAAGGSEPLPVELELVYRRELVLRGTRSADSASLRAALAAIGSGRIDVRGLVTHELPLARFTDGVGLYRSGRALKVAFRP